MKIKVLLLLFFYCTFTQAQLIIDETLTPIQLVQNVLVDPSVAPFNITLGGGASNVVRLNAARFATNFNPTNLGLDEGVILATGRARVALGPNNFGNDTEAVSPTATNDPDLQILSQSTTVKNSTVLEFDFVATGVELNFDFIFASEEYPEYSYSGFNDSFGFFLSGPGLSGPYSNNSTNIALIPGTTTGVSINTINNGNTGTGPCNNCTYYVNNNVIFPPDPNSTIEYDGFTTVLKAVSPLICGETYHIKLAVGNVRDDGWDSAVFLKNFRIAPLVLVDNLNLEENLNVCFGETVTINSGLTVGNNLFVWRNGTTILPETGPILTTTTAGNYSLTITTSFGCQIGFDEITIGYRPEIAAINPPNLTLCHASSNPTVFPTIDQTSVILNGLNPSNYEITYYSSSYQDAFNGVNNGIILNSSLINYALSGTSATIWVRIQEIYLGSADCVTVKSFVLNTFDTTIKPVTSSVVYCQNAPAAQLSATGTNLLWYATAVGGTGTINAPTADTTTIGTFYFYVTQSEYGCESDRAEIVVTITAIPSPPLVTTTIDYCQGEIAVPLSAAGINLLYYSTLNGGTGSASAPLPSTVAVGTTAYYVSQTVTGCESPRAEIVVNIGVAPLAPFVISSIVYCQNTLANSLMASGSNLTWYSSVSGGTGSTTAPIPSSAIPGNTFYYVSQSNGCEGPRAAIEVVIVPTPNPPSVVPVSYCEVAASIPLSAVGTNLLWYDSSIGGTGSSVAPTPQTSIVGTNNYYVSQTVNGCDSTRALLLVSVNPLPIVTPPATMFQCSNGVSNQAEFNLSLNNGTISNGVSGITVTYYTTLSDAQNEISAISSTNYIGTDNEIVYIRVENVATNCFSTTTIELRVTEGPVANTPFPLEYCDPNNDGFGIFDLNEATNNISGGLVPPGVSVSYHETETDALIGGNAIPLNMLYQNINMNAQTIYVRVFYTLTGCANYVQLELIVNTTPDATEPDDYELCDYTASAGYESFNLTTAIPQILGSLNPLTHTVTFYNSQTAAAAGTGNITTITNYTNATINTETIYVRIETNTTGCYDIVTLQLTVNPLPNATQPNYPQYSLCDVTGLVGFETFDLASQIPSILLGQTGMEVTFYPSFSDAQNDLNALNNLQYNNAVIYVQTLGIRISNNLTGCYVISTIDIRVEPLPTPVPTIAPYTICDDNQDGISCGFDLASLETAILQGANYNLSFYETQTDAILGDTVTEIDVTQPYCSINPFVQLLYVRAVDNITGCYSVITIELNVDPSPISPLFLDNIVVCDADNNAQSASTFVDLTQRDLDVLAQQPLAANNYTVSYYTTQLLAQEGTAPIIQATNYAGVNLQTIWVRIENNVTQCFNIGSFLLEINTPLLLNTPAPLSLCDDDALPNNQYHAFNLTVKDSEINQGTNYTVTYYPSLTDAQNGANTIAAADALAYVNIPPAVQTLGVVVSTTAGCKSITTLNIRVLPLPTPNTNPPALATKCDDSNPGDMLEIFDLTVHAAYIINGNTNLTLHYFNSQSDALVPQNEILAPANALVGNVNPAEQSIWIRVENNRIDYQGNNCYVLVEQPLSINPLPIVVQPLASYKVCDDNADGIAVFDLSSPMLASFILGTTQLPADYTISYYLTAAGANTATNTGETPLPYNYINVMPNTQNIYIRVTNKTTGCVNTGVLPLAVEQQATATQLASPAFNECDDYNDPFDGVELVDLTTYAPAILGTQNPAIFLVSYYTTQNDAVAGTNALTLAQAQAYETDPDVDTIWVKVENSSNSITPFCYAISTIDIRVERKPNPIITTANGATTICVDFNTNIVVKALTLESGITNPGNYTFQWFENGATIPISGATGSTYTVDTASATGATVSYMVQVTNSSSLACETTSASFNVIQSGQAVLAAGTIGYTVTNAFSGSQIITVLVEGYGAPDYEYSLDDGPRQSSNVFENVTLGTHVIHVWDTKGGVAYSCEELIIEEVQIIDYPHYFTPNGDGIHDTWNIVGLSGQTGAKIYIFDRYGKLLKQISSAGNGWDGSYNGQQMPSDDYWFTVDYTEQSTGKQFKAHFSLKR